jgi:hypothetical protein
MLKKIIALALLLIVGGFGQCLIGSRVGVKLGPNYCVFTPSDGSGELSDVGFHFGIGMGTDFFNFLSLDMTPMIRSTKFSRTGEIIGVPIRLSYSFSNIYLPVVLSLKAGMLPLISPYIGAGLAGNFMLSGTIRIESGGSAIEDNLENLENDFFFIFALGIEFKLPKFRISPELSINYNLTADIPDPNNITQPYEGENGDFHFSLGLYYTP